MLLGNAVQVNFSYVDQLGLYIRMPISVGLKWAMGGFTSYEPACGLKRERATSRLYGHAKGNPYPRWAIEDKMRLVSCQKEILSPVYGSYTNTPHHKELRGYARGEMALVVRLKPSCKSKCTFTLGDSFLTEAKNCSKWAPNIKQVSIVEDCEPDQAEERLLANHWYRRWDEWRSYWRSNSNLEAKEASRLKLEEEEAAEWAALYSTQSTQVDYIEFQHWGPISWADVEAYEIDEWN